MRKILLRLVFLLHGIVAFPVSSYASHAFSVELYYRWLATAGSDSTYEFTANFLRNCGGLSAPTNLSITAKSVSRSDSMSFTLIRLPISGPGVPPLQPYGIYNCYTSPSICIEEYSYRGTWTSPGKADDWVFFYDICNRPDINHQSENLLPLCFHVECGLNNLDFPDSSARNWSPVFHTRRPNFPGYLSDVIVNYALKVMCSGKYYSVDGSAKEYQSDSLVYSFYHPQGGNGDTVPYKNGFSLSQPFPTAGAPTVINPVTGVIPVVAGIPSGTGIYNLGIEAAEYRNDTTMVDTNLVIIPKKIGYVRRELLVNIVDSNNFRFDSTHIKSYTLPTMKTDSTVDVFFYNGNLSQGNSGVRCNTLSADGSEFLVVDSSTYIAPFDSTVRKLPVVSASWACDDLGVTFKVILKLAEPMACGDFYVILKQGTDLDVIESECGFVEPAGSAGHIVTNQNVSANIGPDSTVCNGASFSKSLVTASGFASYLWNTSATTSSISVFNTGTYWVEVTNNFLCKASDTMRIYGHAISPVDIGNDSMVCRNTTYTINLDAGSGYASYLWNNSNTTSSINVSNDGIYWVRVTDTLGCQDYDSLIIDIDSSLVVDLGVTNVVCDTPFTKTLTVGSDYKSYLWNTSDTTSNINVSKTGIYWVMVQSFNNCLYQDTLEIRKDTSMAVYLQEDTTVCEDDTFTITLAAPGFMSYLWSTSESTSSIQVSDTGTYWVEVVNDFDCKSSDTMHITSYNCHLGIQENGGIPVQFYPNPADEFIFISLNRYFKEVEVKLIGLDGGILKRFFFPDQQLFKIPLSFLESGIYIVEIKTEDGSFHGRFVKR